MKISDFSVNVGKLTNYLLTSAPQTYSAPPVGISIERSSSLTSPPPSTGKRRCTCRDKRPAKRPASLSHGHGPLNDFADGFARLDHATRRRSYRAAAGPPSRIIVVFITFSAAIKHIWS